MVTLRGIHYEGAGGLVSLETPHGDRPAPKEPAENSGWGPGGDSGSLGLERGAAPTPRGPRCPGPGSKPPGKARVWGTVPPSGRGEADVGGRDDSEGISRGARSRTRLLPRPRGVCVGHRGGCSGGRVGSVPGTDLGQRRRSMWARGGRSRPRGHRCTPPPGTETQGSTASGQTEDRGGPPAGTRPGPRPEPAARNHAVPTGHTCTRAHHKGGALSAHPACRLRLVVWA